MKQNRNAAPSGNGTLSSSKSSKKLRIPQKISATSTQREAFAATAELRRTEKQITRQFFYEHPNGEFSRADLSGILGKPINHVTRIVYDLLDADFLEVHGRKKNPRSGVTVETLRLKQPSAAQQLELFN